MRPLEWMRAVRDSDLPRAVIPTAYAIGLRADKDGRCWPTYDQIAKDVGLDPATSRRNVMRRVKALREGGWLMVTGRANGKGSQSNFYLLTIPETPVDNSRGGGSQNHPGGVTRTTPGVVHRTTLTGWFTEPPRRENSIEVSGTDPKPPVDNRHLAALLANMSRNHGVPS